MKAGLWRSTHGELRKIGGRAIGTLHQRAAIEDHHEGVARLLEPRAPAFKARWPSATSPPGIVAFDDGDNADYTRRPSRLL